jgi:hypothetical protein
MVRPRTPARGSLNGGRLAKGPAAHGPTDRAERWGRTEDRTPLKHPHVSKQALSAEVEEPRCSTASSRSLPGRHVPRNTLATALTAVRFCRMRPTGQRRGAWWSKLSSSPAARRLTGASAGTYGAQPFDEPRSLLDGTDVAPERRNVAFSFHGGTKHPATRAHSVCGFHTLTMVRWMAVAFAAVLGSMGEARAETWERKVELNWVPKREATADTRSWIAEIPSAFINRLEISDINGHFLGLTYDDGTYCSSVGSKSVTVSFSCGSHRGHYTVTAKPGQPIQVIWTTSDPSAGAGRK